MAHQHLEYPRDLLDLRYTLACGQAFRWSVDNEGWWAAPVKGKIIRIKECDDGFLWDTLPGAPDFSIVADYFRLDTDVNKIYEHLAASDIHLERLVAKYRGLRLVRQDPEETLLSFICSTANSVPRIMAGIEALSAKYGDFIDEIAGRRYYSFPSATKLAAADPVDLYATGGLVWRATNVGKVAQQILGHSQDWFASLRAAEYLEAKGELLSIHGVGEKIADCVCLFALDKDNAVPVDTHIRQVAVRYYMPELKTKTITTAAYAKIMRVFHERFGPYAGWAQEFLFYEDLLRGRSAVIASQ